MRFPVDMSAVRVRVATPPGEDRNFETGEVKQRDGKPLFVLWVTLIDGAETQQVRVRVPGPVDVAPDDLVQTTNMRLLHWDMNGKSGLSFTADSLVKIKDQAGQAGGSK